MNRINELIANKMGELKEKVKEAFILSESLPTPFDSHLAVDYEAIKFSLKKVINKIDLTMVYVKGESK